jgi:hypothetical protein
MSMYVRRLVLLNATCSSTTSVTEDSFRVVEQVYHRVRLYDEFCLEKLAAVILLGTFFLRA